MQVQPNMPMQHYATSSSATGGSSAQQARQSSGAGAHAPHIVKIKRPASRDHMVASAANLGGSSSAANYPGVNGASSSGLP